MVNLVCDIKPPPCHPFPRRSILSAPGFHLLSDTIPGQLGHRSNPVGHPSNPAQKLSDSRPEPCPTGIGMLSGKNRNPVRQRLESLSDRHRNTQVGGEMVFGLTKHGG